MRVSADDITQTPATLSIETRTLPPEDRAIGLVTLQTVTLHDWQATADLSRWYLDGPADDPDPWERTWQHAVWYTFLSPTLIFSPLAGADLAKGYGVRIQPDPQLSYGELGLQSSLFWRPSHHRLEIDITAGGWAAIGVPLRDHLDLSIRGSLQAPVFHRLNGHPSRIVGGAIVLSTRRPPWLGKDSVPLSPDEDPETD